MRQHRIKFFIPFTRLCTEYEEEIKNDDYLTDYWKCLRVMIQENQGYCGSGDLETDHIFNLPHLIQQLIQDDRVMYLGKEL